MARWKMVYDGEWVRVRNFMNAHFRAAQPCEICRNMKCDMVWYSIRTRQVRCGKCFDAELEHWSKSDNA
jgi:hypothetical protein